MCFRRPVVAQVAASAQVRVPVPAVGIRRHDEDQRGLARNTGTLAGVGGVTLY